MPSPVILNVHNEDTFGYPLLRIVGTAEGSSTVVVQQNNNQCTNWPVVDKYFKALVLLHVGENVVNITGDASEESTSITCIYKPEILSTQCGPHKVKLFYYVASDSDGKFQAPKGTDNSLESAIKRVGFSGLLMQTFCAFDMQQNGYEHKTFDLEMKIENDVPEPVVHVFKSKYDTKTIYSWGNDWTDGGIIGYDKIWHDINDQGMHEETTIRLVIIGSTFYNGKTVVAQTALGGGNQGMFGSGALHTWASGINDVQSCWTNETRIPKTLLDDSCNRGTYWANYATGLGASMHEIGHCFGLVHTKNGIMARGFDNFNRFFLIKEPGMNNACIEDDEGGAFWHSDSAKELNESLYFANAKFGQGTELVLSRREKVVEKCIEPEGFNTYWIKEIGWFRKQGYDWFEYTKDGDMFCSFEEVSRDDGEQSVLIFDSSREMYIKISADKAEWRLSNNNQWNYLSSGSWKN
jgi:hypothetical protein